MGIELAQLQFLWFTAFVILIMGYAILDGFDLGVGMLHLFSKSDEERRLMLNTIGPVWDGNAVWLVTAGGALFAGFPPIYATFCTAFYIPVMVLLCGLIFRAVAIEVRSKQQAAWWRWTWDALFSLASFVITLGLGMVVGNLIHGVQMGEGQLFAGGHFDFINPYSLLVGLFLVSIFTLHGALYAVMKTEGVLREKIRAWIHPLMVAFTLFYVITSMATMIYQSHMVEVMRDRPWIFIVVILSVLTVAYIPREVTFGKARRAFAASCLNIVFLTALFGIGTFPTVIRAVNDPANLSLTIFNSSSSEMTLQILLLIALIGMPLVISYTVCIYWVFRGKVRLDATSY
ncbi:MAG: cytochrome d ubiquinol oxidase subunit II [Chlamydiia bacterium]|nr:cytochrome d ubiquinol oxidase subunit II [Chlamydiia bacterium]